MKKIGVTLLVFVTLMPFLLKPKITFYDRDATIELIGTATLNVNTATLLPVNGTIHKDPGASITGSRFFFRNGILTDGDFAILMTSTYDPSTTTSIELDGTTGVGDAGYFVNNPGFLPHKLLIKGSENRFEGLPAFVNSDAITLFDTATTLTISLQRKLDQDIVLNGGSIVLDDNLELDDYILLDGPGTVFFDGNNLTLGKRDLIWTSTIFWDNACNLLLGARETIYGQWIFEGDCHIIGNDNTIDLAPGGTIWVKSGTKLRLSNMKINGLGTGHFVFEDKTSEIQLFRVGIDLNADYTFTNGGVIVVGPSAFITRDKFAYFSQLSSLTVDGIHLLYDTLEFLDRDNIRTFTEIGTNNYGFLNGGCIRRYSGDKVGDFNFNGDGAIDNNTMVTRRKNFIVNEDSKIDGEGQTLAFSRLANEPILQIKPGKKLEFFQILLKDLPVVHIEQPVGSRLVFGEDTTVELGENGTINTAWEFDGTVLFNGRGKTIELGPTGQLILRPGAKVFFDDIKIRGIRDGKIVCLDDTCTVTFGDVTWVQDDSFSFTQGHFDITGLFAIEGTGTFEMAVDEPCTIQNFGQLQVARNTTFLYAPSIADRNLLVMTGSSSEFFLNGGTLASTTTGLQLTVGTLIADSKSFFRNDGATSISEGISLGNGISGDDLEIKIEPAATLELLSGILSYENVG